MQIILITGPMFSGKTSSLIKYLKENSEKSCIALKHSIDDRHDENNITSHDGDFYKCIQVPNLMSNYNQLKKYDIIAIDEGQFFDDLSDFCMNFHKNYGDDKKEKTIIISLLNSDFRAQPWPSLTSTIPYATKVKFLKAICSTCHSSNAIFTSRKGKSKSKIKIGGPEMYYPSCSQCFFAS